MADLTSTRSPKPLHFAAREPGHIVVVDVPLFFLAGKPTEDLFICSRPQRCDRQRLRLPTSEESGTVRAWQHANFARDRANCLGIATVGANPFVENLVAIRRLEERIKY